MVKKKGYVQLTTSHGNINLELFCDVVPKTCENFIGLCAKGYYDGTVFHRSIRNFIVSRQSLPSQVEVSGAGSRGELLLVCFASSPTPIMAVSPFHFPSSFKEVTRREQVVGATRFGEDLLRTISKLIWCTKVAVCSVWQTPGLTRTNVNCEFKRDATPMSSTELHTSF